MKETYLIWSHEHKMWWGPGGRGYAVRLSGAGRYFRDQALDICANAVAGAMRGNAFNELPVPEDDVLAFIERYKKMHPYLAEFMT